MTLTNFRLRLVIGMLLLSLGINLAAEAKSLSDSEVWISEAIVSGTNNLIMQGDTSKSSSKRILRLRPMIHVLTPTVSPGDEVKVEVMLGNYDTSSQFYLSDISHDGLMYVNTWMSDAKHGIATITTRATGLGKQTITGTVVYKHGDGRESDVPFEASYNCNAGNATIAATMMNTVYVGIVNPISVSVGGARPEQMIVTSSQPAVFRMINPGSYSLNPTNDKDTITLTVSIKNSEGNVLRMGQMQYKVRPLPEPITMLGTVTPGKISMAELSNLKSIEAQYGTSFVVEDSTMEVTGYKWMLVKKSGGVPMVEEVKGKGLTSTILQSLLGVQKGDVIIVTDVKTKGLVVNESNGGVWTVE